MWQETRMLWLSWTDHNEAVFKTNGNEKDTYLKWKVYSWNFWDIQWGKMLGKFDTHSIHRSKRGSACVYVCTCRMLWLFLLFVVFFFFFLFFHFTLTPDVSRWQTEEWMWIGEEKKIKIKNSYSIGRPSSFVLAKHKKKHLSTCLTYFIMKQ